MSVAGDRPGARAGRARCASRCRRSAATWPPSTARVATARRPATGSSARSSGSIYRVLRRRRASASSAGTSTRSSLLAFSVRVVPGAVRCCSGCRASLPFNPTDRGGVAPLGAFNVAVSFVTNTNWQWYSRRADDEPPHPDARAHGAELRVGGGGHGGRRSRSSAASPARGTRTLGNFWVDLVRTIAAHPAAAGARVRRRADVAGRDPELRAATPTATTDRPDVDRRSSSQSIPGGPVAIQEAIKQLGTNGGGFFNANSAHPFENPNGDHQLPRDCTRSC